MRIITFRLTTALIALGVGGALVTAFMLAGNTVKGPLDYLFSQMASGVRTVEARMMIESRTEKRSDQLQWFAPYTQDMDLLRNPERMLLGAFDNQMKQSLESIIALEDSLRTTFPLVHVYTAWGDSREQEFPSRQVNAILASGSLPVITWEPWLSAFSEAAYPQLRKAEQRDKGGMRDVAEGKYDFYLRTWAATAAKMGKPVFVRLGHEMNDPYRYPWGPQNNTTEEFVAAWKHIHTLFQEEQATNVLWIWSPHPSYGSIQEFYPGDSVVDYVGLNILNYGAVASWSQWWPFDDIIKKAYNEVAHFEKPMMLTELGSLEVGGDRSEWFAGALDSLQVKYPAVKSVLFFHFSEDNTTTLQTLNWYFKDDSLTCQAIRRNIVAWGLAKQ